MTDQMLIFICNFFFLLILLEGFRFLPLDVFFGLRERVFDVFFVISSAKIRYLQHILLILRPILVVSVL